MDLKQLQYFVVSVDSGSFKKTAELLYTSQPHVSKIIKSLETELQTELLIRKARGVEATEAGKKVYEHACRILVESGQIYTARDRHLSRTLRVAAHPSDRLEEVFRNFYIQEKDLDAQYLECDLEGIFQALHRHTAEVGFTYVDQRQMTGFHQTLEYKRLEFTELGRTGPLLFVGPQNPLYRVPFVTGRDLRDLHYIQSEDAQDALTIQLIPESDDYRYYRRCGKVLETNSRHLMINLLLETELCHIGCSFFPEPSAAEAIRGIPIKGTENSIFYGYINRKRDGLSEEGERFVQYVRKTLVI
ncbi:MAG TPA: LysR family transcriptional regulator [Candidatus Choladocola avistercoris]|nr:LysR family transcriptional regulator [Candidatus Choladocola avistercoris]